MALMRGLLESDGYIVAGKRKNRKDGNGGRKVVGFCTASRSLAQGIIYIFRQLGIFPSVVRSWPKPHKLAGRICRANYEKTDVYISSKEQIRLIQDIWQNHKDARKLTAWIASPRKRRRWKPFISIGQDCVGLKVISAPDRLSDKYVYDISVEENQNFVAGEGGMVCHNTVAPIYARFAHSSVSPSA